MEKKIGLFFGSFNPIHIGHLIIAEYIVENTDIDAVWFVITPHNPFKNKSNLIAESHRYYMTNMAIENDRRFKASDIEFRLNKPSYTSDTLVHISEKHPKHNFVIIMGEDNYQSIKKWKNYQFIIQNFPIYIYPRKTNTANMENLLSPSHKLIDAPIMELSSSYIRHCIKEKKDYKYMLTEKVYDYIQNMNLYK